MQSWPFSLSFANRERTISKAKHIYRKFENVSKNNCVTEILKIAELYWF